MKKLTTLLMVALASNVWANTHTLDINVSKMGAEIQPTMYGIFLEDINYGADGGLYAEMVKNRSFEFPQNLMGWRAFGKFEVRNDGPFDKNPHYVRLGNPGHNDKHTGLENEGFFGFSVKQNSSYRFSVWARCPEGGKSVLQVQLVDNDTMGENQAVAGTDITVEGTEWKKYTGIIKVKKAQDDLSLRIFLRPGERGRGLVTTDVEHVSLFPTDTWKGRENGMRKDIAQALNDLKPGVFRFPGGCIVEGTDLETRYQWKNTVGPRTAGTTHSPIAFIRIISRAMVWDSSSTSSYARTSDAKHCPFCRAACRANIRMISKTKPRFMWLLTIWIHIFRMHLT